MTPMVDGNAPAVDVFAAIPNLGAVTFVGNIGKLLETPLGATTHVGSPEPILNSLVDANK